MPADQDNAEELLATIAQQVAQASRTTALHIEQHDDIEKAAQEKADVVISKVRETLESAHQSALDQATEALKSSHNQELHTNLTTIAKKFNETLDDLVRHHRSTLQEHIETLKKADAERAESHSQEMDRVRNEVQRAEDQTQAQRREMEDSHREALAQTANTLEREREARNERYQQLCSDTTTRVEEILAGALEESAKTNEARFTETRETIARQKADADAALAERDAKWRRTTLILAGATLTAIAAAIAAVMMALT